jgi:protein SCO1/2
MKKAILLSISICFAIAACQSSPPSFKGTEMPANVPEINFTLTDQNRQPFTLNDQRGKATLIFFGFTYCPDVCPLTLSIWKRIEETLGDDAASVRFVYISVDPERDTPEKMAEHLAVFSPNFIGLTGTLEELLPLYSAFGVYREKEQISESAAGYIINHTARMFLLDRNTRWRLSFAPETLVEDIVHDIRLLVKEKLPQISVDNIWSWPARAATNGEKMGSTGAVFMTVTNSGDVPDRLTNAYSEVAEAVEIHETVMVGDRMKMQQVTGGIEIPVRGQIEFKPRSHHVMLIGITRDLQSGEHFPLVLEFEKSGNLTVESEVRQP